MSFFFRTFAFYYRKQFLYDDKENLYTRPCGDTMECGVGAGDYGRPRDGECAAGRPDVECRQRDWCAGCAGESADERPCRRAVHQW